MKIIYLSLISTLLIGKPLFAQTFNELNFSCSDHDDSKCSPFSKNGAYCPDQGNIKNNWKTSHGSPNLRALNSPTNTTPVAILNS